MKINKEGYKIITTSGLICLVIWALIYYFISHDSGAGLLITSTITLVAFLIFYGINTFGLTFFGF